MIGDNTRSHSVTIHDRKRAELTGISEVENFHDAEIELLSDLGTVIIEGEGLKIESFSVDTGKIEVTGNVTGVYYYEKAEKSGTRRGGLFARRQK